MTAALRRLQVIAIPVAWLLALALVAAVCATLFWRFTAPPMIELPVRLDTDPRAVAQRIAGQQPFGGEAATAAVPTHAAVADTRFTVIGVATGFAGGPGFALLKDGNGDPRAFVAGDEIASGIHLARILPDGVEIDRGGKTERIRLPAVETTGIEPATSPEGSPDPAARPATDASASDKN